MVDSSLRVTDIVPSKVATASLLPSTLSTTPTRTTEGSVDGAFVAAPATVLGVCASDSMAAGVVAGSSEVPQETRKCVANTANNIAQHFTSLPLGGAALIRPVIDPPGDRSLRC